jgi:hypothetical protein
VNHIRIIFGLVMLSTFALALSLGVILHKGVISQLAIIFAIARFLLLLSPWWSGSLSVIDTLALGDTGAQLVDLLVLLLTAFAGSFVELFHLSLALGTQSSLAFLFGIASSLELGFHLGFGGATAVPQGTFALANGLLVSATIQTLVLVLVVESVTFPAVWFVMLAILWWQSEARDGLLDTSFKLGLHGFTQGLPAFATLRVVSTFFTTGTAAVTIVLLLGSLGWRSASVAGIASIDFAFDGREFGLSRSFALLVAVFHTLVEFFEFGRAVLG